MVKLPKVLFTAAAAVLLVILAGSCAGLQPHDTTPLPFDPQVSRGTLANGLTYFIRENHEPENRIVLRLFVNAGSILEDDDQEGIAHLLEHMAFNGSEHFAANHLEEFLEAQGMEFGPDLNAYTTYDETVYQLELPADNPEAVEKAFIVLRDWANGLLLEEKAIDDERLVVREEWRLRRSAEARIRDKQIAELLKGSRYAERKPIGDMEDVMNTPAERIRDFYSTWYIPANMAVAVAGDISSEKAEELIRNAFDYPAPENAEKRPEYSVPFISENREIVLTDPELTMGRAELLTPMEPRQLETREDYQQTIREILFWNMLNSRLEDRTKEVEPPFLRAGGTNYRYLRPVELSYLSARAPGETLLRSLKELLTEVRRVQLHGFTQSELDREKARVLKAIENAWLERENRQSSSIVKEIGDYYLEKTGMPGIEYEHNLFMTEIPLVSLNEVEGLTAEFFPSQGTLISLILPEGEAPPTAEDIRSIRKETASLNVPPYSEEAIASELVPALPAPGSIVSEEYYPAVDMSLLTLSNGLRLGFKQTDFDTNRVILSAFSPGGESLLPLEELTAARTAVLIQKESGLGDFTAQELDKFLADKDAEFSSYIGAYYEGFSGSSSTKDLEYLFQLIHLAFTAPRFDQEAFQSVQSRIAASVSNRDKSPRTLFSDTLTQILSSGSPRREPFTLEKVSEMDLNTAEQVYNDRFANAGDFTVIVTGDTDLQTVRKLAEIYLAALPASHKRENVQDNGIRPVERPVAETIQKGIENQATQLLMFNYQDTWTPEKAVLISATASILDNILGERIREEMGGTYSISAWADLHTVPYEYTEAGIYFGSDPDRVEELTQAVLAVCEELAEQGPEERFVNNVEEAYMRSYEEQLEQNSFWTGFFESAFKEGRNPEDLLTPEEYRSIVDADSVRRTAAAMLDTDNLIQLRQLPEN